MTQAVDMLEVVAPLFYAVKGDVCCPRTLASPVSGRFVKRAVAEMDTPKVPCKPGAVCIACEADETAGCPQHEGVPRTPRLLCAQCRASLGKFPGAAPPPTPVSGQSKDKIASDPGWRC